jgi:hypothetical protein
MHEVRAGITQSVQRLSWELDYRWFWVQFQVGSGNFYLLYSIQTGRGAHSTSYKIYTGITFFKLKRPLRKLISSASTDVKNAWSNASTSPLVFRTTLQLFYTAKEFSNVVIRRILKIMHNAQYIVSVPSWCNDIHYLIFSLLHYMFRPYLAIFRWWLLCQTVTLEQHATQVNKTSRGSKQNTTRT